MLRSGSRMIYVRGFNTQWPIRYGCYRISRLPGRIAIIRGKLLVPSFTLFFFLIFRWTRCRTKFTRGCRRNICGRYTAAGYISVKRGTFPKISQGSDTRTRATILKPEELKFLHDQMWNNNADRAIIFRWFSANYLYFYRIDRKY